MLQAAGVYPDRSMGARIFDGGQTQGDLAYYGPTWRLH